LELGQSLSWPRLAQKKVATVRKVEHLVKEAAGHPWGAELLRQRRASSPAQHRPWRRTVAAMTAVERWERRADVPLLLLAAAFLVAYAWPVVNTELDSGLRSVLSVVSWTVYLAFAVDFAVRLLLAENRGRYAAQHWYDVALVLLPMLRPLRLLRLLAFARVLNRSAVGSLVGQVFTYVVGTAIMAVGLGAIAVLDAEQDAAGANIKTLGDAAWWACTTVMTVGYGDRYPVTTQGRLVAVALMVVGIAMVGAVTASVAAWMVAQVNASNDSSGDP
jgi:voltage-gated potassium channel